jgi:hypothetical protein
MPAGVAALALTKRTNLGDSRSSVSIMRRLQRTALGASDQILQRGPSHCVESCMSAVRVSRFAVHCLIGPVVSSARRLCRAVLEQCLSSFLNTVRIEADLHFSALNRNWACSASPALLLRAGLSRIIARLDRRPRYASCAEATRSLTFAGDATNLIQTEATHAN